MSEATETYHYRATTRHSKLHNAIYSPRHTLIKAEGIYDCRLIHSESMSSNDVITEDGEQRRVTRSAMNAKLKLVVAFHRKASWRHCPTTRIDKKPMSSGITSCISS